MRQVWPFYQMERVFREVETCMDFGRTAHHFITENFRYLALVGECVEALRHDELHFSRLTLLLNPRGESFPLPQDGSSFCFLIAITFLTGCVWPWCFAKLRAHVAAAIAVRGLNVITVSLDSFLLATAIV